VFGCDDTAKSEFLNKRAAKGTLAGPGQSQSNLWFTPLDATMKLGPAIGRGGVWVNEPVKAGAPSDPFLLDGFTERTLWLSHDGAADTNYTVEIDQHGDGHWATWKSFALTAAAPGLWIDLSPQHIGGAWIRVTSSRDQQKATAQFQYANADTRGTETDPMFAGLSPAEAATSRGAFLLTRGGNLRTLSVLPATLTADHTKVGAAYELTADMKLVKLTDAKAADYVAKNTAIPAGIVTADAASVIFTEGGQHWRLPRAFPMGDPRNAAQDRLLARGALRKAREVCTERDLLQAHGTFYELPALNAKGAIRMRPVATSDAAIHDYCSYRGLLVLSGVSPEAAKDDRHVIRSDDGKAAVWVGAADDLWQLGKPRGHGGPWLNTAVQKGAPSDPYLMTGYDKKTLKLTNHGAKPVRVSVLLDVAGDGRSTTYRILEVPAGKDIVHAFEPALNAYWVRFVADEDAVLSAQLTYE
jgi:hypothetical protein